MPGRQRTAALLLTVAALAAGCHHSASRAARDTDSTPPNPQARIRIESPRGTPRPPYRFSQDDAAFLEEVQHGAFNFLWNAGSPDKPGHATGMAPDRTSKPEVSVAGVGFQLSGICIGVEHGWITRDQGRERAELILRSLTSNPDNRKAGFFYHFLSPQTAGQPKEAYERTVSTIDSALLFAGILTASQYFGGEVGALGDRLFSDADFKFFVCPPGMRDPTTEGFISLGWQPSKKNAPTGEGHLLPYAWVDSGDEHRLVTFLAACAPIDAHRPDAALYFRQRRMVGEYAGQQMVWFPWSGALFTNFFASCWIDYSGLGLDNPSLLGIDYRPRVDWWENSRRMALMHRSKAIENPKHLPGLGQDAWGLTASDIPSGYGVPGLFPTPTSMPGAVPVRDIAVVTKPTEDDWGDGTLAPYGAGSTIMFCPQAAVAALRHYRALANDPTWKRLWADPSTGGYGFADAYNAGKLWVAKDCLAIDQGPLLLSIENARTGLIWKIFMAHPFVKVGSERLRLP